MKANPPSVDAYLDSLPPDRREALEAIRAVINRNLPRGYEEGIQYGMIGWYVPHSGYPDGYHCDPSQPLPFASIASQKNHMAIYMMCIYGDPELAAWFHQAWKATGKRLDMGKSCVRFRKLEDVPLEVVGEAIRRMPVQKFVEFYESNLAASGVKRRPTARKVAAPAGKQAVAPKPRATKAKKTVKARKAAKAKKVVKAGRSSGRGR